MSNTVALIIAALAFAGMGWWWLFAIALGLAIFSGWPE